MKMRIFAGFALVSLLGLLSIPVARKTLAQDSFCYYTDSNGNTSDLSSICGIQEIQPIFRSEEELKRAYGEADFSLIINDPVVYNDGSYSQTLVSVEQLEQEERQEFCEAFAAVDKSDATEETEDFYELLESDCGANR